MKWPKSLNSLLSRIHEFIEKVYHVDKQQQNIIATVEKIGEKQIYMVCAE